MIKAFYSKSVHSCFSECYFLQPTITSSLSYPNILGILFSHILNLRLFVSVTDHISHPYVIPGKITVSYTLLSGHQVGIIISHVCYMPCPSHPPWFDHTLWKLILKILSFWNTISSHRAVVAQVPKNFGDFVCRIKQGNNSYLYKYKSPSKFLLHVKQLWRNVNSSTQTRKCSKSVNEEINLIS